MKTYLRHKVLNVIDIKELIDLEFLDFEGKHRDYEESHEFWELCFVTEGEISAQIGKKRFVLAKNHLILISPTKRHVYYLAAGNQNRTLVVCFDSFLFLAIICLKQLLVTQKDPGYAHFVTKIVDMIRAKHDNAEEILQTVWLPIPQII